MRRGFEPGLPSRKPNATVAVLAAALQEELSYEVSPKSVAREAAPPSRTYSWKMRYTEYFKYYEAIRSYIAHENAVLNFRITWTILLLGAGLAAMIQLLNNKQTLVGLAATRGIPAVNQIPGVAPHLAVAGTFTQAYYYGFLLHMISDSMLATSVILFCGVTAMTKSIRNMIQNWQCVQLNVELWHKDDHGKEHLVPPVFSGHHLYAFGVMPRFAASITCIILGISAVVTAEGAWPVWPWAVFPRYWFFSVLDLSAIIVSFYMVYRSFRRLLKHPYVPARHDAFLKAEVPDQTNLKWKITHWWDSVGMMYVSEEEASSWRNGPE